MQAPAPHTETQTPSTSTSPILFELIDDANSPGKAMHRFLVTRSFEGLIVGLCTGDQSVHDLWADSP